MTTSTSKRLFQYGWKFKKRFSIAILFLAISITAELLGPMFAKKMIDTHILGIEKPWYEVKAGTEGVSFDGRTFQREDRIAAENRGKEVRLLQVERKFVFVDSPVGLDGARELQGDQLTVSYGGKKESYPARVLNAAELLSFYRFELHGIYVLGALFMGVTVISALFHYGQKYLLQTSANRVIQKLRGDVYRQIQRLPVSYFDNLPAGKVVSRVTNDTEAVKDLFVSVLANFFTGLVYMTGIFVALFLLDVRLASICLVIVPILVVWVFVYRKFATTYNQIIRSRISDINGIINESIQGMPILRAFRREKHTMGEFETLNNDYFKYQNKMLSLNAMTGHNLVGVLRNLAFIALIWYFGGASISGATGVSIGVLYAFVDYLNRLFQPIVGMVNQLAQLEQALVSAGRVFELMDEPGEDVEEASIARYKGNVEFKDVSFAYKGDERVLKRVSFQAKQGQTVALVGHTGSGKSSILNLLFRFYDPQDGVITVDGCDTREMSKQSLRQHMGIVLQDPFLFTGTIESNVSLGDPSISRERVEKALRDVGAGPLLASLPGGLDEPVLEKGSTLSAGQRQLISFARALAFDPAILILDEATASIDTETEAVIQQALDVLKRGRTTFIIAHRLSTIRAADQILVLHRGEIVERGDHDSLMEARGRYHQMYQLQQGVSLLDATAPAPRAAAGSA